MDKPGVVGKAPAKGTTKFRSAVVKARNQGMRMRKKDYRFVKYY